MNRWSVAVVFFLGAGVLLFGVQRAAGQDAVVLSDAKRNSIVENCSTIRTNLSQLHTNDALLRVNRGQVYASLSSDYMARLNSRIALNRLDAAELVQVTSQYEEHHTEFRTAYQVYSDELLALMRIDCEDDPEEFYAKLVQAREKRAELHQTVERLNDDIRAYDAAFERFRTTYRNQG